LFEVGRNGCSVGFFPPLAVFFLLVGLRRGSVLCLRHPGMIAPIPREGKPLGFEVDRTGTPAYWSTAVQGDT
jgi:hypothetical protein